MRGQLYKTRKVLLPGRDAGTLFQLDLIKKVVLSTPTFCFIYIATVSSHYLHRGYFVLRKHYGPSSASEIIFYMLYFAFIQHIILIFLLRFDVVGYGCMTCIGNSGPLPDSVVEAITQVQYDINLIHTLYLFP